MSDRDLIPVLSQVYPNQPVARVLQRHHLCHLPPHPPNLSPPLCFHSILLLPRDHALVHGASNQATTPGHALHEEDLLFAPLYNKTGSFKSHTTKELTYNHKSITHATCKYKKVWFSDSELQKNWCRKS